MKILVTGAAGFIGSSIARAALDRGDEVIGLDSMTSYYETSLKEANLQRLHGAGFSYVQGDLLSIDLASLLKNVDVIYHQAGQPGVRSSWGTQFADYTSNNVLATQRLLEASRASNTLKSFVYASSSSVYGNATKYPTSETDLPAPVSPYGVTKLAAEHLCTLYAKNFGVPTTSLRYFTVYGPRQRPDMAFTRFCRASLTNTPITIYGDGSAVRDFTYVDDIVAANLLVPEAELSPGQVLNISGGSNVSVNDVLGILTDLIGRELLIERGATVDGDVWRTGGSSDLARDLLGWAPRVSVERGLRQQLEYVRGTLTP